MHYHGSVLDWSIGLKLGLQHRTYILLADPHVYLAASTLKMKLDSY